MHRHIKIVAWIYIVYGLFVLLSALALGGFLGALGASIRDAAQSPELAVVGIGTLAGVLGVLGLMSLAGGLGLLQHRSWGRIVVMIVAALTIFGFPVGTAMAVYAFWVLTRPETRRILSGADTYPPVHP